MDFSITSSNGARLGYFLMSSLSVCKVQNNFKNRPNLNLPLYQQQRKICSCRP